MVGLRAHEVCHFCNHKIALEDQRSIFDHYEESHKQEMETVLVSNNMADCIKTVCKLCDNVYPVVRMRTHVRVKHDVTIGDYKQRFNIATDRDYELIRKVLHKCGICGIYILLCADVVATHCKKHRISHADYNKRFMEMVSNPKDRESVEEKIKKPRKRKIKEQSSNEVSVPFDPSMILAGDEMLNLDLFTSIYSEEDIESSDFKSEDEENLSFETLLPPEQKRPKMQKNCKSEDVGGNKTFNSLDTKQKPKSKVQLGDPTKLESLMDQIMGHYASGPSNQTLEENVSLEFDFWNEC